MKKNTQKTIFITSLLIILIVFVWIGNKLIETTNQANGFKAQSTQVSSTSQEKTEINVDSNKSEAKVSVTPVPEKVEPKSTSNQQKPQTDTPKTQTNEPLSVPEEKANTCTISIQTSDKFILNTQTVEMKQGDTVFDILKKVTREKAIQMEFSGASSSVYVKGIDNLYQFDKGPKSGWLYSVNKEFPQKSCGAYKLSGGEVIRWHFSLNMGEDIKE